MSTSHLFYSSDKSEEKINPISFEEVKIYENDQTDLKILKQLCDERESEEPFYLFNVGDIVRKHLQWLEKFPRIVPHYAVKCNPHPTVVKIIASLGGNFDCASKEEMNLVMSFGVSSDRIIYANPIKFKKHIEHAKKINVSIMTVDSEEELEKIKRIYPEAKILIRIRCDAAVSSAPLGEKYGCDPKILAPKLIRTTIQLGLNLVGFCFHLGSPCGEPMAFHRGIKLCHQLIDIAKSMGCKQANIIDIGGGMCGERSDVLDEFSNVINKALEDVDTSIKVIAEPGRYYVTSAFTVATPIFGKKTVENEKGKTFMYYMSDGCYNSFMGYLLKTKDKLPVSINNSETEKEEKKYVSTVWGPTCDSFDAVLKNKLIPEYNTGDWLAWSDMGAYSLALSTNFNGFQYLNCYPIIRLEDYITLMGKLKQCW